jgi:hypothetical protein
MILEEGKRYRVTAPTGHWFEFIPMTIDRDEDEIYLKMVAPFSAHECFMLSQMENDTRNKIEEVKNETTPA